MAKTVQDIDKQIAALKARRQKLKAQEGKQKRKNRNHALAVFGGEVVAALGGDYTRIDPAGLHKYLQQYSQAMKNKALMPEAMPHDKYDKFIRTYEKQQRELKKGKQGLEDNSGYPQAPAESVATSPTAASIAARNLAQDAFASGGDYGA